MNIWAAVSENVQENEMSTGWWGAHEKSQKFNIKQKIVEDHSRISRFRSSFFFIRCFSFSLFRLRALSAAVSFYSSSVPDCFPLWPFADNPKIFRRLNSNCFPLYTCTVYSNIYFRVFGHTLCAGCVCVCCFKIWYGCNIVVWFVRALSVVLYDSICYVSISIAKSIVPSCTTLIPAV